MQTFRVFVSSPGDAHFERQRVDRIVARLNGELAGSARFLSIRWETEFYRADATFQSQIPASMDCDVVVAIFRARLGTELPPDFQRMPDGSLYPSGTAFEVLTAIEKRQRGGELPDVFVFRCPDPPTVRLDDNEKEDETRKEWGRLKAFFADWFLTSDGHFKAAFQTFVSTDDFEAQCEQLLRNWLRQKLAGGAAATWPIATMGSPFLGLRSFGPKHAPVFFGRARDTARSLDTLLEAGARGTGFVLIVGASGSGKSSLARAGLVPRLTTPGVVQTVDAWRVAALRPGDSPAGPFVALAHALLQGVADLPKDEEGRQPALPEIAASGFATDADLGALLAHADAASLAPIMAALDRVADEERRRQAADRPLRCDLVILIDQFDDLFAASVSDEMRRNFAALLGRMLASGRIWVVATLRADLYELFLKEETFFRLKEQGATYDLAPPAIADLAEAIRGPARAANLTWEIDPHGKETLDERLIRDVDRPDLLPIVQFVLDRLFQQRDMRDGAAVLTHAAYDALGTLDGAIDTAAEGALASLDNEAVAQLPRLLRALVSFTTASAGTAVRTPGLKQASLETLSHDAASARLIAALTEARILVAGRDAGGAPVVSLAHQRVIEAWERGKALMAQSAELLRVRDDVEQAQQRWEAADRRKDLLIPAGLQLSEAENAAATLGDELAPATRDFVQRAGRASTLRHRLVAAAALVFLVLAIASGVLGIAAYREQLRAEQAAAEALAQRHQAELARADAEQRRQDSETARKLADMRLAAADELLEAGSKTEELRQCLASTERVARRAAPMPSRAFFVGRWHVDQSVSSTDVEWREDGTCRLINIFNGGRAFGREADTCTWTYEDAPDRRFAIKFQMNVAGQINADTLVFRIVNPTRIHNVGQNYDAFRIVCPAQELKLYRDDAAARQKQIDAGGNDRNARMALAASYDTLGDALLERADKTGALEAYDNGLRLRQALAQGEPAGPSPSSELTASYDRLGNAYLQAKQYDQALGAFRSSLAIRRNTLAGAPDSPEAQRGAAITLEWLGNAFAAGGMQVKAREAYETGLLLRRRLAESKPEPEFLSELAISLYLVSRTTEPARSTQELNEALQIVLKLERDNKLRPEQAAWPQLLRNELKRPR